MVLLSALGKIIAESGGPHILNECEILAKCSLNSFYKGKNYKRYKRMHKLLALGMQCLHFETFLQLQDDSQEVLESIKKGIQSYKSVKCITETGFIESKELEDVLSKYLKFVKDTEEGRHGKTAQFWMNYIQMIQMYHTFTRSIRTGNFDIYTAILPEISNYFFALNHHNYTRWSVKYHDNLTRLPHTHPEVYDDFKKGWFGMKRTAKPFSRIPKDLTIEQTINDDAASQRIGISYITDSISAWQRWADSHFLRTSIISNLYEEFGLTNKEDITKDLRRYRREGDNESIKSIKMMVKDTINPFDNDLDTESLYNLNTGNSAEMDTEHFLLNIKKVGNAAREHFINECLEDSSRFESPLKAQMIHTFATEIGKKELKGADGKLVEACLIRDLFGSILYLPLEKR